MKIVATTPDGIENIIEVTSLKVYTDIKEFRLKTHNEGKHLSITEISGLDMEIKPNSSNKITLR